MRIAFIGVGRMGRPMSRHLVEAGHDVVGLDIGLYADAAQSFAVAIDETPDWSAAVYNRALVLVAPWCGSAECEAQIKADTQATIRNMPLDGERPSSPCVRCGNPARAEAWFAKAY